MSTFEQYAGRNRDMQDGAGGERVGYEEMEAVEGGGHIVRVRGSGGTEDDEVIVLSINGIGIHMPKGTNAEVHLFSLGGDTNNKVAIICTPHDKEHKWKEGTNGQQFWNDPERRLEFNKTRTHITDNAVAMGSKGIFEIKDGKVYIRGELHVEKAIFAKEDIHTEKVMRSNGLGAPNVPAIPGFEEA